MSLHQQRVLSTSLTSLSPLHVPLLAYPFKHAHPRLPMHNSQSPVQACTFATQRRGAKRWQGFVLVSALESSLSPESSEQTASTSGREQPRNRIVDALFYTQKGTTEHRVWRVRPYAPSDFSALVQLQTDSFHTPLPLQVLDKLAKMSLRAEVLDGLRQKEKSSDPNSYVVLVADDVTMEVQKQNLNREGHLDPLELPQTLNANRRVQAVVEVMKEDDWEVLSELQRGTREYTYISSMAVAEGSRRRGLASAVLAAAEQQSQIWGQPHVALHVYEDNLPAIKMYTKMGMQIVKKDHFLKKMLGGRVRLLMYKRLQMLKSEEC